MTTKNVYSIYYYNTKKAVAIIHWVLTCLTGIPRDRRMLGGIMTDLWRRNTHLFDWDTTRSQNAGGNHD